LAGGKSVRLEIEENDFRKATLNALLDHESEARDLDEVRRILDESHGIWNTDESVENI